MRALWITLLVVCAGCESPVTGGRGDTDPGGTDSVNDPTTQPTDSAPADTDTCANLDLRLERQPVTIALVVDNSASMNLQLGDNDTRWSVLVHALMGTSADKGAGLVWQLQDRVRFGMVRFTAQRNDPQTCPLVDTVAPALMNGAAIADICRADDESYRGASPVPEAIRAAKQMLDAVQEPGRRLIVLATDGWPQTCQTLAQADDPVGREQTIAAVEEAHVGGIPTFVVGIGDESAFSHLQQVANAGAGLSPDATDGATFYQGLTENSLVSAMGVVITGESRSCIYELDGKGVAPGEEGKGQVLLDGEVLTMGDTDNGWRLKSPGEIELLGAACETIQVGDHHLDADFPCEAIIIIE